VTVAYTPGAFRRAIPVFLVPMPLAPCNRYICIFGCHYVSILVSRSLPSPRLVNQKSIFQQGYKPRDLSRVLYVTPGEMQRDRCLVSRKHPKNFTDLLVFRKELQLCYKIIKGDSMMVLANFVNDFGTRLDDLNRRCHNPEDCHEFDARHCKPKVCKDVGKAI
jgi:hypothetical protein